MSKTSNSINSIFEEHEKFIVLGLTGRTGSGCSTLAKILNIEKFKDLALKTPQPNNFTHNHERKYRIIYKYAQKHWKKFTIISMSDIITSFVFEKKLDDVIAYLESLSDLDVNDETINKLKEQFKLIYANSQINSEEIISLFSENTTINPIDAKEFYEKFKQISSLTTRLKDNLKNITLEYYLYTENDKKRKKYTASAYTFLYQNFGNNLRSSGNPFSSEFSGQNIFTIAKRARTCIKNLCTRESHDFFVIDAIRNPYEAQFFRDRYAAFYLVSVNTKDDERRKRLSFMTSEQIKSLDQLDYPLRLKGNSKFFNQDIGTCIQLADIHITNPLSETNEKYELTKQIIRYVTLMMHPGLVTPTHVERCMQLAYTAKLNSGCISRQVGAVVTDQDFSVKSVGWNDVPKGQVPCSLRDMNLLLENDESSFSCFEKTDPDFLKIIKQKAIKDNDKLNGRIHSFCFKKNYNELKEDKNQVYTRALHAEENAFLQLAKYNSGGIKNGYLFTSASPCELCSKKAYQLGIRKIYYIDPYPGISESHILKFGNGDNDPELNLFFGAIGKAYINLYTQYIPIKDELETLLSNEES